MIPFSTFLMTLNKVKFGFNFPKSVKVNFGFNFQKVLHDGMLFRIEFLL